MDLDRLPSDLMADILSRLPGKFLCQCKCVSKKWLNIISSNPGFQFLHHMQSKKNPLFLFISQVHGCHYQLTVTDLAGRAQSKFTVEITKFSFLECACCGGLVCLSCNNRHLYVCNPITLESVLLPESQHSSRHNIYGHVAMGYFCSTNEYKFVRFFYKIDNDDDADVDADAGGDNGDLKILCEIFTLRDDLGVNSGSWKLIGEFPYVLYNCDAVCVNGAIYWIAHGIHQWDDKGVLNLDLENKDQWCDKRIVYLDLEDEELRYVCCPWQNSKFYLDTSMVEVYLIEVKGFLCLVSQEIGTPTIDLWMLKDSKNGIWVNEYSIRVLDVAYYTLIRGYVPANDHNGDILIFKDPYNLFNYNTSDNSLRRKETYKLEGYRCPYLYLDNLFSLGTR